MSTDDDIRYLRGDLERCRLDLAAAREQLEPLGEALADERFRRQTLERRIDDLADLINRQLLDRDREARLLPRLRRLLNRSRASHGQERRQAQQLQDSGLFSNAFYLTRYPDVLESYLPPAVHYLRIGAGLGYNPSADFSTRGYLKRHPRLARSGVNPLLHYLERSGARGDGS